MKRRRIVSVIWLFLAVLFVSGMRVEAAGLKITGVTSGKKIYTGHSYQLGVKAPKAYRDKTVTWKVKDKKIGTISPEGMFKAKRSGRTVVQAKIKGTKLKAELVLTVERFVKTKKVKIDAVPKSLGAGSTFQLDAVVTPADAVNQKIEWSSDDPKIAAVSAKGKLKAKSVGKVTIRAKVTDTNVEASFVLKVKKAVPLKKLKIGHHAAKVTEGDVMRLDVARTPSNTTFTNVTWKSSDHTVISVSEDGEIHALKAGKAKITVKSPETKKKDSIWITVEKKKVPVTGITFAGSNAKEVEFGSKIQLHAKVTPANATNQKIIWSSSNTSKATVDQNGVVTALRPTELVEIKAKTADKKYSAVYQLQITAKHGFLTKADLDRLNLTTIKKVMIVAHPDDETLWGGSHLLDAEYLVVCLTNGWHKTRSSDFGKVMSCTNEKSLLLSYPDTKRDYIENGKWTYDTDMLSTCMEGIKQDLDLILSYKKWDMVVTHNPDGEYKKYCHQMTSKLVTESFRKNLNGKSVLYYFGRYYDKGETIPGEQIPAENLEIKNTLIQYYLPTAKGAVNAFGHMIPYENWVLSSQW